LRKLDTSNSRLKIIDVSSCVELEDVINLVDFVGFTPEGFIEVIG